MPDSVQLQMLSGCEAEPPHRYGERVVHLAANGAAVFVVSDLHVGAGLGPDGRFDGSENFFADAAFARFLKWASERAGASGILVVNGDVVDFLRIACVPESPADFAEWSETLAGVGIAKTTDELRAAITRKETKYGLRTDDYKSVFKLHVAARGHRPLIDALAAWVGRGKTLVITKGNHDLEWHWRAVRDQFRVELAGSLVRAGTAANLSEALGHVLPHVLFAEHSVIVDGAVYIEHGHRFDRYTNVLGPPVLPGSRELNIPFGSFLNRYLLNLVELHHPFVDNIRPARNVLPLLLRERFFTALKLLFYHIPFTFLIIPKNYYRYLLARVLPVALALAGPIILLGWNLRHVLKGLLTGQGGSVLTRSLGDNFVLPAVSYFLGRIVAWFQLDEPSSLDEFARDVFLEHPGCQVVTFGHTHNPDQCVINKGRFYNTGTWIPIVETSTMDIRADLTYTFLEIGPGVASLQRWNDNAGRAESLRIIRR